MGMFSIRSYDLVITEHYTITRHLLRHVNPDTQELEGKKIALFDVYADGKYFDSFSNFDEALALAKRYEHFRCHALGAVRYDPATQSFTEVILNG